MKYIMLKKPFDKSGDTVQFIPVIFPSQLVHADVAKAMVALNPGAVVHSAGEYTPMDGSVSGRSETLNVDYDPDDRSRILFCDYGMCFE